MNCMDESAMEEKFPCVKCGKLRTKNEGGTTFTICDACWKEKVADRFPPRCILDANELEMTGDAPAYLRIPNNGLHFRDNHDVDYLSLAEHQYAMDALRMEHDAWYQEKYNEFNEHINYQEHQIDRLRALLDEAALTLDSINHGVIVIHASPEIHGLMTRRQMKLTAYEMLAKLRAGREQKGDRK